MKLLFLQLSCLFLAVTCPRFGYSYTVSDRWSLNLLDSFEQISSELGPKVECRIQLPKKVSLAEKFCVDPYEVICGVENKNSKHSIWVRAQKLYEADAQAAFAEITRQAKVTPENEEGFRSLLKSHGEKYYSRASLQLAQLIERKAWSRTHQTPQEFFQRVSSDLITDIQAEVSLTAVEKQKLLEKIGKARLTTADDLFDDEGLKRYRRSCGTMGPGDKKLPAFTDNARFMNLKILLCPGAIYNALVLHPMLKPQTALERYYSFGPTHELGHVIDVNRLKANHKFSAGCFDGPENSYSSIKTAEMIGDYWGISAVANKLSLESLKKDKDQIVRDWFLGSEFTGFCGKETPDKVHPRAKFRIESLIRNSRIRRALGCQPYYLGKKSCDIEMK